MRDIFRVSITSIIFTDIANTRAKLLKWRLLTVYNEYVIKRSIQQHITYLIRQKYTFTNNGMIV